MRKAALASMLVLGILGCEKKPDPPARRPKPIRFEDANIDRIVPLPNGDAYAVDMLGEGVWLLRKGEAVRVRVKEVPAFSPDNQPGPSHPFVYQPAPTEHDDER